MERKQILLELARCYRILAKGKTVSPEARRKYLRWAAESQAEAEAADLPAEVECEPVHRAAPHTTQKGSQYRFREWRNNYQ
jgi:hypothetical protein